MSILYVACPYSHIDPEVREYRFRTACRASALLMKAGIVVFSPLSHSVPIAEYVGEVESDHEFWLGQDIPILQRCEELLIIGMPGWTESLGVRKEMFEALALQKPITLIDEEDIFLLPNVKKTSRRFLKSALLPVVDDIS
ncbi:MAG TPA: DUF1937 domain-containing protein [Planctomycetaceae bacterium]|nr:DUF1937 domain-containing protein [Planctomycetaceae bacterium]